MSEKLYTEADVRQAFLAGYKQAVEDPARCRPSEFIATLTPITPPVPAVGGVVRQDSCPGCGHSVQWRDYEGNPGHSLMCPKCHRQWPTPRYSHLSAMATGEGSILQPAIPPISTALTNAPETAVGLVGVWLIFFNDDERTLEVYGDKDVPATFEEALKWFKSRTMSYTGHLFKLVDTEHLARRLAKSAPAVAKESDHE